jgi:hypothetical protein
VTTPEPPADFLRANPFSLQQVTYAEPPAVDVPAIHDTQFRQLTDLAALAHNENLAVGAVIWGESGSGKSHLLRRLGEWAGPCSRAVFVNFLELLSAPERLPRAVLNAVVGTLTGGPPPDTPLFRLLQHWLRPALVGRREVTRDELGRAFHARVEDLAREARTVPAGHPVFTVLHGFLLAGLLAQKGRDDGGVGALAVRRLAGDGLEAAEARSLGLGRAAGPGADLGPLDGAGCLQVLAALAQVARANGLPLVVGVDQLNNLPREQIAAVARLLHDLNDHLRNTLIVLAEVQEELVKLREAGAFSQATWERLSAYKITLPRLTPDEGRRLLRERLAPALRPFSDNPHVRDGLQRDELFPLGVAWYQDWLGDRPDVRPRQLIMQARERWRELPGRPVGTGADDHPPPAPAAAGASRESLLDECVERELAERRARHNTNSHALPVNAANLRGLVEELLTAAGFAIGLPKENPAYDLVVTPPGPAGAAAARVGLLFVDTGSATKVTNALGRLVEDPSPPERVLLVTDQRQPLVLGKDPKSQGRKHLDALKDRGVARFEHVELPFEQYADLEALSAVARQASDLEIPAPGGPPKREEVIASHRRRGRLHVHPLLGRLLGPPVATGGVTNDELRAFLLGRLADELGAASGDLVEQFWQGLPAERQAGLDRAGCRRRLEGAAAALARDRVVSIQRLEHGWYLLLLRRPAAI